ncbi:hypothetical protein BV22DRAFT_837870 [Leucogyrophana mollusca]|uniref:Uncharacterized protein n=1 Tax=Leucogyrophana mollusca TaxID=85980 RepID=A0ACB8B428_9AGAM|nr:hypothetical protein BV22DRAFT_837870 [Leucogyrophana mollusca]
MSWLPWRSGLVLAVSTSLALVTVYAGNTTCLSGQLDWYTDAVGESPCITYQRMRQICDNNYEVPSFRPTTPGDNCDSQVVDCCCNSMAFTLSMLCMNCQQDASDGDVTGIDAGNGSYSMYLSPGGVFCGQASNGTLPADITTAICNSNIKLDSWLNRSFWSNGAWYYDWTREYAVEQQAINNNNTWTMCGNQVSTTSTSSASTYNPTAPTTPSNSTPSGSTPSSSPSRNHRRRCWRNCCGDSFNSRCVVV